MHSQKIRGLVLTFALIICLAPFSCKRRQKDNNPGKLDQALINVLAVHPQVRGMEAVIEVHGNLAPSEEVDVVAETSGTVVEVLVKEGDRVRAGELLARLDDKEARLSLDQAETTFEVMESDYLRTRELYSDGMASRSDFEKVKRSFQDAKSNLEMTRLRLKDTVIKSPIAGLLVERNIEPYQRVGAMESLFKVADVSAFRIPVTVTEAEVAKIRTGQKVRIRVDAVSDNPGSYPFQGDVERIKPMVNPNTGTVELEVLMPAGHPGLRLGMFARLMIVTDVHEDAVVVPRRALVADQTDQVWVVEGDRAGLVEVKTGLRDEKGVEVLEGVSKDDLVITEGQSALTPKSRINIVNPEDDE